MEPHYNKNEFYMQEDILWAVSLELHRKTTVYLIYFLELITIRISAQGGAAWRYTERTALTAPSTI